MQRLSLRTRLFIVGVVIPAILLVGLLFYLGRDFANAYREARLTPGRMIARQVSYTIEQVSPYINSIYDLRGLDEYLSSLTAGEADITFVAVVDENGKAIYHSQPQMAMRIYTDLQGLWSGEFDRYLVSYHQKMHLIVRSVRLPGSNLQRLYVVVGMPASAIGGPRWLVLAPTASALFVFALIVILFSVAITRWVTNPISRLAEGAARLGAGELSYRLPDAPAELGFLARTLNGMAERLQGMIVSLEERVAERTSALMRRTQQLEAVMMVARESLSSREVDTLLQTAVRAVSNYFGFYHAGIFLLDDARTWAVLQAASSEGGARMLARGHRLRVGRQGIVGTVAATGKPRIALDVGDDAVWFNNPDLPKTRSEMALPLRNEKGEVIGVLDVQSEQPNAFGEEDISVLQLLADQLSIALQNTKLIEQTQIALREMELLQREYMQEGWARVMARQQVLAYEYDRVDVRPVLPLPIDPHNVQEVVPAEEGMEQPFVIEPMRYRDQTIGLIALSDPNRRWSEEEVSLVRDVSTQISIALENARLFEEAQRSARYQALLNAVLQAAAVRLRPDEALRDIADILARGLGMVVGVFTFVQPDHLQRVYLQAFVSPSGEGLLPAGGEYELPLHLQIFLRGLSGAEMGKLLPLPLRREVTEAYEMTRALYVTIRTAQQLSGFLVFIQRADNAFMDPETRELARNIASQVAVVLENLNLLEETQQRSHELQMLYDISLRFGSELDAEAVRSMVVEQAAALIDADGSAFIEWNPRSNEVRFSRTRGILQYLEGRQYTERFGISRAVFQEGRDFSIADYSAVENPFPPFVGRVGSIVIVPLRSTRGVIGALLAVRRPQRSPFTDDQLRLMTLLAAQAAVALENARLYEESTRRAEALQQLYEAGLELVSVLDVQRITEIGAQWAQRLLGVDAAAVYYWDEARERFIVGVGVAEPLQYRFDALDMMPRQDGAAYRVLENGQPLLINDLSDFSLSVDVTRYDLHSMIAIPLRLGTKTVGVLFALSGQKGFFNEEHMHLLEFLGTQMAAAIQNALYLHRMEEARALTERQARYQSAVAKSTMILAERGSQALDEVLEILGRAMEVEWIYYLAPVFDEGGGYTWQTKYYRIFADVEEATIHKAWSPELVPHWTEQFLHGEGIVATTLSDAPMPERRVMEQLGVKSLLLIAVEQEERDVPAVLGFTALREERIWGVEELNVARTTALAIAGMFSREHLLQQVRDALNEAETLYRAAQALNVAVTYEDIIDVLRAYTVLGRDAAYIVIQVFDRPWSSEQPPERLLLLGYWCDTSTSADFPPSFPIRSPKLFEYVRGKDFVLIEDAQESQVVFSKAMKHLFVELKARGALLVPMVVGGQWIGFVSAVYHHPITFTEDELTRLKALVGQAAVAVQNRFQLEVTASRARRERLVRQIGERFQHAPDIDSLLASAAEEIGRLFQARHTSVHIFTPRAADLSTLSSPRRMGAGGAPEEQEKA